VVNSDLFYVYGVHRGASWLGPFVTMIYQMCRKDCVQFLVIYGVFMAGFVQGFAALSTVVGSARMVRIAYNMQRSGVRPSVRLSVCPIIRRRRVAGLLLSAVWAGDIDRQCRAPSSNGAAARRSAAMRAVPC